MSNYKYEWEECKNFSSYKIIAKFVTIKNLHYMHVKLRYLVSIGIKTYDLKANSFYTNSSKCKYFIKNLENNYLILYLFNFSAVFILPFL